MVLAAVRDGLYNLVLALHIVSVLVGFAPAAAHPITAARVKRASGDSGVVEITKVLFANSRTLYVPAQIAIGVFGILLVLLSDEVWEFTDTWVWLAIVVWGAIVGVVTAVILPGEKALAAGDLAAEKRIAAGGQVATLGLVVMLWLMIWKPGA